jgi:Right handed beta helix region
MFKSLSPLAAAGIPLSLPFLAAPAQALSRVTYVSVQGSDSGTCASPAAPCRSFQFAFGLTSPGGEINALDPGGYGAVTITHSISITGVEGAGINVPSGDQITINAGQYDRINLTHLTLDGGTTASDGIVVNSGGSLTISYCTVRNFSSAGIFIQAGFGTLDHVLAHDNINGIVVQQLSTFLAVDSTAADNVSDGFSATGAGTVLRLAHSVATRNTSGVYVESGATGESAGDNFIRGNSVDVFGTLTNVGTQ